MNENILDTVPTTGTVYQEVTKKLIFIIEETFEQCNTDDIPGIDGANIGLAIKLEFHVASYVRIPTDIYSSVLFSRNCRMLEVENGARHGHRAHHQ